MSLALAVALLFTLADERPLTLLTEPGGPGVTFTFPATDGRLDTGLWFGRGQAVSFEVTGEWTMWEGHFGTSNALGHRYRVGLYGWGALMGRVGGGAEFAVGMGRTVTTDAAGQLYLYPNTGNAGMPGGAGELQITVRGGRPQAEVIADLARQGTRLTVPADKGLVSDLFVEPDQEIVVDAFGEWTMYEGAAPTGPDGDSRRLLADHTPWGRLMMRVGGPDFAAGETYRLASQTTVRVRRGGLLSFAPATGEFAGHPRSGELTVVVRGARQATPELRARAAELAADHERQMAVLRLAQYRRALVLPPAAASPELMRAAQAQAEVLAIGRGTPQTARGRVVGFAGQPLAELAHGYTDGVRAIDGLWQTVRGRRALADTRATAVGVGVAAGVCLVLTGELPYKGHLPQAAVWPADGANGLPGEWSGQEEPPVVPVDLPRPFGSLVSLTIPRGLEDVLAARLTTRDGQPVPLYIAEPEAGGDTLVLVPLLSLRMHETYDAEVEFVSEGEANSVKWRFTIGRPEALPLALPRLDDPANPPIDLGRPPAAAS